MGVFGAIGHAVGDAVDTVEDVAEDVADVAISVGNAAYKVTKEFAEAVEKMADYVLHFADEAVEKVVELLGLPWPEADEDKLRELAHAYTAMAEALDGVRAATGKQAATVTSNNRGPAIDNFATFWSQYDGGKGGWLGETGQGCRDMAKYLNDYAKLVDDAKDKMRTEILAVAATILAGVGLSVATAGAASGAAAAATATVIEACGAAAGSLAAGLITAAVTAGVFAVQGALVAIVVDVAVTQPIRIAGGAQDGLSLAHVIDAAEMGAAGGAVGGAFASGAGQLPGLALKLEGLSPALAAAARNAPEVLNSLPGRMISGAGGAALTDAVTGKPISLADLAFGAAGGTIGGKGGAPEAGDRAINIKANNKEFPAGTSWGDLSPKSKALYRNLLDGRDAMQPGLHTPVARGEVNVSHLAELQSYAPHEFAIVQNQAGDMRILTGHDTYTNLPPELKADGYKFILHTHPEDTVPGAQSPYGGPHSMRQDLRSKAKEASDHVEAVINRNGQYTYFDKNGFVDLPPGSDYHPLGPIDANGHIVPVPGIAVPRVPRPQ
ncbi:hypothetical protein [Yinghuangia seranimata]|uniref:WXG100-like domain-containing protein n=1 Tax=Yinghuangia seranimata TaxID=408067 RepID=UPI00248AC424|nr:hypothetical protein [Yinghuangia seranimata]MDI2128509.1 hypothetical protein [Yinghuangia seranimata]